MTENKHTVEQYMAAFRESDHAAILACLTDDVVWDIPGMVHLTGKEAFDRDHARLELERAQMEEQQRRANEALRLELHRQTIDREVGRLRLLAGTAMVGWIASVILLGWRLPLASPLARVSLVIGWLLLLGALGSSFQAMGRTSGDAAPTALPMWLLLTGLGATAMTLLL